MFTLEQVVPWGRSFDEYLRHVKNHNHVLWALMNVALWHRCYIEGREAQAA